MIFRVSALAAVFAFGPAHADCVDPYKPAIERTELSTNHNSYAEESEICITEKAEYCDHCVAGYKHKCEGGWWQPQTHLSCSAVEVDDDKGSESAADRGTSSAQRSPTDIPDDYSEYCLAFERKFDECTQVGRSIQNTPESTNLEFYCRNQRSVLQCKESAVGLLRLCNHGHALSDDQIDLYTGINGTRRFIQDNC